MKRFLLALILLCAFAAPAWALDPDGTWVQCPGTVVGVDGTWTCPGPADLTTGQYVLYLNGVAKSNGMWDASGAGQGYDLRLGGGGHLFTIGTIQHNPRYQYKWTGSGWAAATEEDLSVFRLHSQVHNAAGWLASHPYTVGQRVNSGPGWNATTQKWVPYSELRAYQANGNCTSGSTKPTGTGDGSGNQSDGGCSWHHLSITDYVTLTGWGMDAPAWTAQAYGYKEVVAAPDANGVLTMYQNENTTGCTGPQEQPAITPRACGYQVAGNCNSTAAPPNNPGTDSCNWVARVAITYSSGTNFIPKQRRLALTWMYPVGLQSYQANLWNDQQYVMGANGETNDSYFVLAENYTTDNHTVQTVPNFACGLFYIPVPPSPCTYNIVAAPGESFVDKLAANPSLPLRYDPSYGVSIVGTVGAANFFSNFKRLQIFNPTGPAVSGFGRDAGEDGFENNIIEVGTPSVSVGSPMTVASAIVRNNLIISHGPDSIGYVTVYATGSLLEHSTVVNPEGTGNTCIFHKWDWTGTQGLPVADTICSGFAHTNGAIGNNTNCNPGCVSYNSDPAKAGIAPHAYSTSPYENATVSPFVFNSPYTVQWAGPSNNEYPVNGMTYGLSPTGLFTGPNDYRIPPTSPLRGAGANYGDVNIVGLDARVIGGQPPAPPAYYNNDATDILGTARPATGQDVGAWQTPGPGPATFTLTVTAPSNGTITGTGGINCGSTCTATFALGATVTLTATPSGGFSFNNWQGACTGGISPCTFSISSNQSVQANFVANSNPVSNRMSRITVRSPPSVQGPPPTGLLQMPAGITGSQLVEVGTGPNTFTMQFQKANVGLPDNHFVLSISPDGTNWTQITDTVNPMTVTGGYTLPDFFYAPQTFIFHGNWGPAQNVRFIKVAETSAGSLNALYTDQMQYDSTSFTYLGPSTGGIGASQGYTNSDASGLSPVIWSTCFNDNVPAPPGGGSGTWVDCPPVYNGTLSQIAGATVDGSPVATGTLAQIADPAGGGHDVVLPAGHFFGTVHMGQFNDVPDPATRGGNRVHGQGQGTTIIDGHGIGPSGGKGLFDWGTYVISLSDLTVTGSIVGGNADNRNNSSNAGCIFMEWAGYYIDNVELTQCQDGIRGHSVGPGSTVNNSYLHDNGSRTGFTHELYLAGGDQFFTLNNTKIVAGDRPGYALKVRFKTVVNGGYFSSCTDPTAQTCAGLLDFPNGDTVAIQGMNTVTVGGTIHAGDVQTMTFQHLGDTPIVVTAAATSTAQGSANTLLTALKANSALATAGWGFHASMPVGGGSTIPNAVDLYAPYKLVDWTITPSVTGGGATTTLTKTMNPVTLVLNSNAVVPNGSTQIVKCQEEFGPGNGGAVCKMYLDNVIIDNRNANAPRIAVGQWDSTPAMPGTELHISNCVYTGGIAPAITSNWATVTGSCTPAP